MGDVFLHRIKRETLLLVICVTENGGGREGGV